MKDKVNDGLFDKEFRSKLRKNPKVIYEMGFDYQDDVQYEVVTNTKDKIYVVFPSPTQDWGDIRAGVSASTASTVGTVGSAGTAGCISSLGSATGTAGTSFTLSSAGTYTTLGSLGTAK